MSHPPSPWQRPGDEQPPQPAQLPHQPLPPQQPLPPYAGQPYPAQPYPAQPYPGQPGPPPYQGMPGPGAPRRRSMVPWLVAGVAVLSLLCCGGGATVAVLLANEPAAESAGPRRERPEPRPETPRAPEEPPGEPTATAGPTAPPPEDVVYKGQGNKTIALSLREDVRHTATIVYRGGGHFVIWTIEDGRERDLLVNSIGRYNGVRPVDFDHAPEALRIEGSGAWQVTVRAFSRTPVWSGAESGRGPVVLRLDPAAGPAHLAVTHTGRENFVIIAYDDERYLDLLVNDIGRYSGEVAVPAGAEAIAIQADGAWTVKRG